MEVFNALDLASGKKAKANRLANLTQPIQFLPESEKDEEWCSHNIDWGEWNGLKQIRKSASRLLKNYKLAKGIIDKSDYVSQQDNEMKDLIDTITQEDVSALELRFYPIIPNIINTMVSEFSKRNTRVVFMAVDEFTHNEMLESKRMQVEQILLTIAEQKMLSNLLGQGMDMNDPESQKMIQEKLNPENLKTLPEIQQFFNKDYKAICEIWAQHQHKIDVERFGMDELEDRGFRDSLIADREFWHFKMMEDDYDIELWNPITTFYHKSPDARYISQGNWVGRIDMMTIADVVDKYGYLMTQDQLESLEAIYPARSAGYAVAGFQNDGNYYDATKSHDWNTNMPGLAYRQYMSMWDNSAAPGGDIINQIMSENEDYAPLGSAFLLRVTTYYWKGQTKVGYLTKIAEDGKTTIAIVSEDYKILDKPIYDTRLVKNKTKNNLLFGEHVDWIWINKVYGGVKIGPNRPSFWGMNNSGGVNPMYLGIDSNKIGPLKYQFKGDTSLYGCKLPVEGAVFSDRNTRSSSLVDMMKPSQLGYNLVNNQIQDILIDELGTVLLLDQNALPQHSMGEDWGKNNMAKAYEAMKVFGMLPLDTSITNTENAMNFQHFQQLNLEQSQRLMSRIQLGIHFKQQCLEIVGITPQRLGQQIGQTNTATGIEQAVTGSYAQTEQYFIQHSDYLMPRVHQMRTDLAQYYHSTKPSFRLQYMTSAEENINFKINGTDLLTRDINIYCTTKANYRAMTERIKEMAMGNNTSGATIADIGNIMQSESLTEVNNVLKAIEKKASENAQMEQANKEKLQQMEIEYKIKEKQLQLDHDALEKEKDRRKDILVAEIRAAGYSAMQDMDKNNQNDFLDFIKMKEGTQEFQESMNLQNVKTQNQVDQVSENATIQREKMATQMKLKEMDMNIARENNRIVNQKKIEKQNNKSK